jgi:hypothetical protein
MIDQLSLCEAFCCRFNCDELAPLQSLYRRETRERALWSCEKKPFAATWYIAKRTTHGLQMPTLMQRVCKGKQGSSGRRGARERIHA